MRSFISIICGLLFVFPVLAQTQGEIIVPTTFLRKSPKPTAEKIQTLQKGEKVALEKAQDTDGWYYVSVSSGKIKGWINGNTFQTIEVKTDAVSQTAPPVDKTPKSVVSEMPKNAVPVPASAAPPSQPTNSSSPQTAAPNKNAEARAPQATNSVISSPGNTASASTTPSVPDEDEVLRIETEEINLNVRVVDGNNRPVNNLSEAHFKVYEDNVLQPITSLTTTEVPVVNALVVDNSRSLRTQLEKVIEAGKIIVGTNRPQDESSVVRFVSADKIEIMRDFTSNKSLLEDALNNLFIEGGQTAIIDAVYLTAKRLDQHHASDKREDVRRRALIVVSDGDDRSSTYSEQQLFDLLRESDVQVYAIGLVSGVNSTIETGEQQSRQEKARGFLTRLAEETGGKVYFPNSTDELAQIANDISADLRTQYLITYAPTNEKRDRSFRNIKVEVEGGTGNEKRTAITRTGRIAANDEKPATQRSRLSP